MPNKIRFHLDDLKIKHTKCFYLPIHKDLHHISVYYDSDLIYSIRAEDVDTCYKHFLTWLEGEDMTGRRRQMKDNLYTGHFSERELYILNFALLKYKRYIQNEPEYSEIVKLLGRTDIAIEKISRNEFKEGDEI